MLRRIISKWLLKGWLDKLPGDGYKTFLALCALLLADYVKTHPGAPKEAMQQIVDLLASVSYDPYTLQGTLLALIALFLYHKGLKLIDRFLAWLEKRNQPSTSQSA